MMFQRAFLKKFALRLLIINIVYVFLKLIFDQDLIFDFSDPLDIYYYFSSIFQISFTWEISDWLIRRYVKNKINHSLDLITGLKILLTALFIVAPISAFIYYKLYYSELPLIHFDYPIDPNHPVYDAGELLFRFKIDFLRAIAIEITIISLNLFYSSFLMTKKMESRLNLLEKEVSISKYKSLKNQISPHFLFNSLNTLTSLMYEDRDLASDFVSRLASSYRYVLDNRETDLVSLEKELNFLDSFIFMMNVRHEGALIIITDIKLNSNEYVIPTLTLQMLVENALKHNYFSKEKPMEIRIFSNDKDVLTVQNTLRKRVLKEESTKLGIKNIRNRYSFYTNVAIKVYEDMHHFKIEVPLLKKNTAKNNKSLIS